MSSNFCTKTLSASNLMNIKVYQTGASDSTEISVTLGKVKKYNFFGDFTEETETEIDFSKIVTLPEPTF